MTRPGARPLDMEESTSERLQGTFSGSSRPTLRGDPRPPTANFSDFTPTALIETIYHTRQRPRVGAQRLAGLPEPHLGLQSDPYFLGRVASRGLRHLG